MCRALLLFIIIPYINLAQTNDELYTNSYYKKFYEKAVKMCEKGDFYNAINTLTEGINTKSNSKSNYNAFWIRNIHDIRGEAYLALYINDNNLDITKYEKQEYLEKAQSDFVKAKKLLNEAFKNHLEGDNYIDGDYYSYHELYQYEMAQAGILKNKGMLLENNFYLDSALILFDLAEMVIRNDKLRGCDLTEQHFKDYNTIILENIGINFELDNYKRIIDYTGKYIRYFENGGDEEQTSLVYYSRGLAKKSAGLSFCSDYRKACKMNFKCDEYWEHCD